MAKNNDEYKPGRLLEYDGGWMLILRPQDMDGLSFLFLETWGYEPNGHSWESVVETLASKDFPELVPHLSFDAEGDELSVMCSHPEPLKIIAQMLKKLLLHPEELRKALQMTEPD